MAHWLFNCSEISRLVSASMDRTLPLYQRIGIRIHLMMCRYCARYRRQLLFLRRVVKAMSATDTGDPPSATLSQESRDRIQCKINDHLK